MDFNELIEKAIIDRKRRLTMLKRKKELHAEIEKLEAELSPIDNFLYSVEGMIPEWQNQIIEYVEEKAKEGK